MKVITCISDSEHRVYKEFFEASCDHHGLDLVTLVYEGPWVSHRLRDDLLRLYLPQLPRTETIMFADGYDSFLVGGEKEILEKYRSFESAIVFAAEDNCWPHEGLAEGFPQSNSPRRYLNGGGFVGEVGVIRDLLERYPDDAPLTVPFGVEVDEAYRTDARTVNAQYMWSNQYYWSLVYMNHPDLIALDREAVLFAAFTLQPTTSVEARDEFKLIGDSSPLYAAELQRLHQNYEMSAARIRCRSSGAMPVQVHFNGLVAKKLAANGVFAPLMPWL